MVVSLTLPWFCLLFDCSNLVKINWVWVRWWLLWQGWWRQRPWLWWWTKFARKLQLRSWSFIICKPVVVLLCIETVISSCCLPSRTTKHQTLQCSLARPVSGTCSSSPEMFVYWVLHSETKNHIVWYLLLVQIYPFTLFWVTGSQHFHVQDPTKCPPSCWGSDLTNLGFVFHTCDASFCDNCASEAPVTSWRRTRVPVWEPMTYVMWTYL